jgi:hypothetical protein
MNADAMQSPMFVIVSGLVGMVIGGLLWGLAIKFLSGPIGQKPVGFGPAFKTGYVIAGINGVLNMAVGLTLPLLGILLLPVGFLVGMFAINKFHGIDLGRSALITLIAVIAFFVVFMVIGLVLAAVLIGAAAAAGA